MKLYIIFNQSCLLYYIDGLMEDCGIYIADALEI